MSNDHLSENQLLELEAQYCSYGDTVHYHNPPKIFEYCEGSYMYALSGQAYLDLQMWYSAANFGYANSRLNKVLEQQLSRLPQVASEYLHKEKILLAARLAKNVERTFDLKGRVHFNVGGSQAIEDSLKLIRNASGGKSLMFAFEGGYHGRTLGASSITSSYRYRRRYGHFGDHAHFVPYPYCFRCPYGKNREDCGLYCVDQFERLFESEYQGVWDPRSNTAEYAAFYIEPVQGTGGYIVPPSGYFEKLKKILTERNILMVDDEIQMGFYRTGKFWSLEHFNTKPDVIVFGKALTNGLNPLSGLWAREELINPEIFPIASTHSTFSSNPLGTAVALETVTMLETEDYHSTVMEKGAYFLDGLRDLKTKHKIIGDVDGLGLALRIEICSAEDSYTPDREKVEEICEIGLSSTLKVNGQCYGLILDVGGYHKNVITLAPSLDISRDEIDLALTLLDQLFTRCVTS